ncbi:MAG: hypothetical protein WCP35_05060 [Verrucomicrobiota bacterium]
MKSKSLFITLMLLGLAVMTSCTHKNDPYADLDPAGEARSKIRISDEQVTQLPSVISVNELKSLWGHAEGQPGPRFTYACRDHKGQFFWVYYRRENPNSIDSRWIVDRILRSDRIEEVSVHVWPPNYTPAPEPKIEYIQSY